MRKLHVDLSERSYDITIEKGCLAKAGSLVRSAVPRAVRAAVITDSNVGPLYADTVAGSLRAQGVETRVLTVPAGESSKCIAKFGELLEACMDFGMTRTDAVVALGGGVVGDLAGFVAASLLRGVDYVQIPTTLLAQVDSSVGGKVAVDLEAGKNLAGAFWQPRAVLMDPDCLDTLSDRIFADGMAEVIKYGCIRDRAFFEMLEAEPSRAGVMTRIEEVLYTCCDIKRQAVVRDERDTGERMLLNFGHTLGHAYELAGHYTRWTHGQAVAAGMCRAADIGTELGVTPEGTAGRIAALVTRFGLPAAIGCTREDYAAAIGRDKKSQGHEIRLVLLREIGEAFVYPMPQERAVEIAGRFAAPADVR